MSNGCGDWNYIEWTYNTGVYLLGAAVMYNLVGLPSVLLCLGSEIGANDMAD